MSAFSSLEINKRALLANRFAIDTTSNNVANANTPGYARRSPVLTQSDPLNRGGHMRGTGVLVSKLQNYRQEFFDKEVRMTSSSKSGFQMDTQYLKRIETILGEPSDQSISNLITNFFNSFNDLASQPENSGYRQNSISNAEALTDRFNVTAEKFLETRNDALNQISTNIKDANALISEIASLNKEIAQVKGELSNEAHTFLDKRELKLEKLSGLMNINVTYEDDGTANVFSNGTNIITKDQGTKLKLDVTTDQTTGEKTAQINAGSSSVDIQNGEFGTLLQHYNVTLDHQNSSGDFSVASEFNRFVTDIASQVNGIIEQGYGMNDPDGTPPGRSLFTSDTGDINAFNIKISDEIRTIPENLPVSDAAGETGNAQIALQIARLGENNTALDDQSFSEFYSNYIGKIGHASRSANNALETATLSSDQLKNQRESVIGVNLDEEAINLVKYQKAFEASSRAVSVTNDILTTLVNIIR